MDFYRYTYRDTNGQETDSVVPFVDVPWTVRAVIEEFDAPDMNPIVSISFADGAEERWEKIQETA